VFESNYFCGRTIHGTVCLHWKQCGSYVMYVPLVYKTCTFPWFIRPVPEFFKSRNEVPILQYKTSASSVQEY
jgi:hypothetical protein